MLPSENPEAKEHSKGAVQLDNGSQMAAMERLKPEHDNFKQGDA